MNKIKSIKPPENMPIEKAITSSGQNEHNYEPEFWEFQYECYRYLENISEKDLYKRYESIKENFVIYSESRRDVIPINCFQSSWYWYRKEYQTRYELFLRDPKITIEPPIPVKNPSKMFLTKQPNSCEMLFRYGHTEFMNDFIYEGKIRVSPALSYKDGLKSDPRTDDELNKHKWIPGKHIKIQTKDGKSIPIIGDMKSMVSAPNYYTISFSTEFENYIFNKFGYDSCVVIKNPKVFEERIKNVMDSILPNWYFFGSPVSYYDPYEDGLLKDAYTATISKDFSYAYQQEYRILWDPLDKKEAEDYIHINIGDLRDICEIYYKR